MATMYQFYEQMHSGSSTSTTPPPPLPPPPSPPPPSLHPSPHGHPSRVGDEEDNDDHGISDIDNDQYS